VNAVDATPFGQYQLQELIGRGGMGEVYRAFDTRTDRVVALKLLPTHLAKDGVFQQRFRRESQAAAGINEPHVVPIHGFGEIDERLYLDMRLIDGRNLGAMLGEDDDKKPLKPALAVSIIEQVAAALDAAHELGLIHRDVKPSNILVTKNDFAYLIDFGLARTAGQQGLTTAGSTLGTMAYMSPERFEGGEIDPRSDVYALTCVLYECLTGSRPYPVDSLEEQIAKHINAPVPKPSAVDPRLAAFDSVIAKGMSKKPARRYQSAGEMAAAARAALNVPVRSTGRSGRHSAGRVKQSSGRGLSARTLAVLGAAVLVGAALVFGVWHFWGGRDGGGPSGPTSVAATPGAPDDSGVVPAIAATLPADIKASGRLIVGVNVPYAPNEFKNSAGDIVGFDVDLVNAVSKTLGLLPEYREFLFEDILPTVQRGEINVGMSSFTDTLERQEQVDFVTYYEAGTLWAQRAGRGIDPNAACGLRIGMTPGSTHQTVEVPAKSDQCVAAGLPPVEAVVYARQDELTAAVINGEVDAMSADSPVTGFAIKGSNGALEPAGEIFDTAPYGWPVQKGSPLAESLRQALEHVMATGEYKAIATKWGVEKGMIAKPVINGAIS
jgi:ABC-type amino acid transport substrate-binding protein